MEEKDTRIEPENKEEIQKALSEEIGVWPPKLKLLDKSEINFDESESDKYFRNQAYIWRARMDLLQQGLVYISNRLKDDEFLDEMVRTKKTLAEMLEEDEGYYAQFRTLPGIKAIVSSYSYSTAFISKNSNLGNPKLGESMVSTANSFAEEMGEHLATVRAEGITSTRKIAERFNELGIKTIRDKDWTHTGVARLINRRKELGFEGGEEGESLDAG